MSQRIPRVRRIGRGVLEVVEPLDKLTNLEKKLVNRIIKAKDETAAKKLLKYLKRYGCRFGRRRCGDK